MIHDFFDMFFGRGELLGILLGLFLIAVVLALTAALLYAIFVSHEYDPSSEPVETERYKVVSLTYVPSRTSTGVGPAIGGKGGIAVTSSTSPEENIVVLKCKGKPTLKIDSEELFEAIDETGRNVKVHSFNTWCRIRLTDYRFGRDVEVAEVEIDGNRICVLGCLE